MNILAAVLLVLAGSLLMVATLLIVLPFNLFQSWIASKIWIMLVVPLTGWPALSWAVFFGLAATARVIHSRDYTQKRDEDKTDFEREHPWANALSTSMVAGVFAPLLLYASAWLVARWVL